MRYLKITGSIISDHYDKTQPMNYAINKIATDEEIKVIQKAKREI